ncbi:MAG TPA: hypothetical protein VJ299_10375 [Steroidobacteraceae bacterium]|jgi:hypothetical protein|nr:hypothetical protein [Steroidobacteraceae bacterium]
MRSRSVFRTILVACGAAGLAVLAWAGLTPIATDPGFSREELFEIPRGTWARRRAGEDLGILPDEIRLTLGIRDILVLRNLDEVPQIFGPTLMMPGQSFRLPFEQASEYQFTCTAHASGQMRVIVDPYPVTPWARIMWRARNL